MKLQARPRPLVVGIGNRHRGDDAAGPMVIDAIRDLGPVDVDTQIAAGDLSALVLDWTEDRDVVLVDAMTGDRPPGSITEVDALDLAGDRPTVSTHGIGIVEVIDLARLLGRLPRSLRIIGIQGSAFDHFAPVTTEVAEAVQHVAERFVDGINPTTQQLRRSRPTPEHPMPRAHP